MTKVLIVEDESLVRRDLVMTTPWEEIGCICIGGVSSGKEAIEVIKSEKIDIVITDIRMPEMTGLELTEIISEMCALAVNGDAIECIILSGYQDFEYARQAMRNGVQEYLVKPVDDDELLEAIKRAKSRLEAKNANSNLAGRLENQDESMIMFFKEYHLGEQKSQNAHYVARAIKTITERYVGGVTVEDAAGEMSISASYLSRIFKSETGYTFNDYLTNYRIKKALELLKNPDVKIYEAADLVGYSDARYFSQIFHKFTGLTPREFRNSVMKIDS